MQDSSIVLVPVDAERSPDRIECRDAGASSITRDCRAALGAELRAASLPRGGEHAAHAAPSPLAACSRYGTATGGSPATEGLGGPAGRRAAFAARQRRPAAKLPNPCTLDALSSLAIPFARINQCRVDRRSCQVAPPPVSGPGALVLAPRPAPVAAAGAAAVIQTAHIQNFYASLPEYSTWGRSIELGVVPYRC